MRRRTGRNLSCRGDGDLDLNLLGGDLPGLVSCLRGLIGPSLSAMGPPCGGGGGEERGNRRGILSSEGGPGEWPPDLRLGSSLVRGDGSLIGVVESGGRRASSFFSSSSSGFSSFLGISSVLSVIASAEGFAYSLESITLKRISTKLCVSDCRKTSNCCIIESFKSTMALSFLIRAITYFARAAGSASHSGSRCDVSHIFRAS